ncbi:PREDICTED: uncharacterized protein LOC109584885 [Amphimedon queenslandica]|uniref:MARVEL domain-containing protein n=1 Tax=Amphimedon queenslandica TaxID=400682 RepID=A0AAN0JHA4_AMPQE|nr:PREDICTED: uncharacterized protein LOC109584885 [Amphimedon queenslandica]|eukprot:XP_019856344.1 PREDICTED: uncharacterized protein LOC109584885 [Amphimedon queenslandica]
MPSRQKLSIASFVILFVSLGAAATSLGLIQGTNCPQWSCDDEYENISIWQLSIASSIIATICLGLLTVIELISVLYQTNVKTLCAKILYSGLFSVSIFFLIIATASASYNVGYYGYGYNYDYGVELIAAAVCASVGALLTIIAFCIFNVKQTKSSDEYQNIIQRTEH